LPDLIPSVTVQQVDIEKLAHVKSILIVDDSLAVRRSLRALLEQRPDWRVCGEGENGREGIDKAQKLHPDLIILDLSMPVMNGFEAAVQLKRLMPGVPLLMLTTFETSQIGGAARSAGISTVKAKSGSPGELMDSVQALLDHH
jgi:DNA-binding NarL/FixJ family response regulator